MNTALHNLQDVFSHGFELLNYGYKGAMVSSRIGR